MSNSSLSTIDRSNFHVIYLDASAFKESTCLEKLRYIISEGLRPKETSSALSYGTGVHKFVADIRSGVEFPKAMSSAIQFYMPHSLKIKEKDFRNIIHFSATCKGYYEKVFKCDSFLPIKKDGVTMIEQKFAFPAIELFPELTPVLDAARLAIILCGTVDEIGVLEDNNIAIKDIKTTTQWNVASYLDTYWLSSQMLFYILIVEHKFKLKEVGAFIDCIILNSAKPTLFHRSDVMYYSEQKRNSFKKQLVNIISQIAVDYKNNKLAWSQNYAACDCAKYQSERAGQCAFFDLCKAEDEEIKESFKRNGFTQIKYEPLRFDEHKD